MSEKHDLTPVGEFLGDQIAKLMQEPPHVAIIRMDPMLHCPELFDEWRKAINNQLCAEYTRDFIATPRGTKHIYGWRLPEHALRFDVTAPFIPLDLRGEFEIEGQVLPWNAMLDLDDCYEIPGSVRRKICVFCVVEE